MRGQSQNSQGPRGSSGTATSKSQYQQMQFSGQQQMHNVNSFSLQHHRESLKQIGVSQQSLSQQSHIQHHRDGSNILTNPQVHSSATSTSGHGSYHPTSGADPYQASSISDFKSHHLGPSLIQPHIPAQSSHNLRNSRSPYGRVDTGGAVTPGGHGRTPGGIGGAAASNKVQSSGSSYAFRGEGLGLSVKDSQDTIRFGEQNQFLNQTTTIGGVNNAKASSTQKLMQKSVDGKDTRKFTGGVEASSSGGREQLLWAQAQNIYSSNNFNQNMRTTATTTNTSIKDDNKNQQSSKTQRQAEDTIQRQQRFRVSTESHISGLSGILQNTQITSASIVSNSNQNSGAKRQHLISQTHQQNGANIHIQNNNMSSHDVVMIGEGVEVFSDEIQIAASSKPQGPTLSQPMIIKGNQQDSSDIIQQDCDKLESFDEKSDIHKQSHLTSIKQIQGEALSGGRERSNHKGYQHSDQNQTNQSGYSGSVSSQHQVTQKQIKGSSSSMHHSKVYSSFEEAKPMLRNCLMKVGQVSASSMVAPGTLASLLPESDSEQNQKCPAACKFIIANPVECQQCQYLICVKCDRTLTMYCQNCDPRFNPSQSGINKMNKAVLSQQNQLQTNFEPADQMCPNSCTDSAVRMTATELKDHLKTNCPREKVPCKSCNEFVTRSKMDDHLAEDCAEFKIQCRHCEQYDTRGAFRRGQHDCISMLKDTISQMRSSANRDEQRHGGQVRQSSQSSTGRKSTTRARGQQDNAATRRASGIANQNSKRNEGQMNFTTNSVMSGVTNNATYASQQDLDLLMRQVQRLKHDLETMDHLVTDDIFRMFDNMSLCVTQKDEEVKDLTKKVKGLEQANDDLKAKFSAQTRDYQTLVAALNNKLEEKFLALKKNQEAEIQNMKRMLLKHSQSDLPLQMKEKNGEWHGPANQLPKQQPVTNQLNNPQNQAPEQKLINHVSIRGPKQGNRVPPINFIDQEQSNRQQINNQGKITSQSSQNKIEPQETAQDIEQDDISHIENQPNGQIREQQPHLSVPEVLEEEEFVPFLSSTDNELTDLNTEFNTDRPGGAESSIPQSTYRSRTRLSSKISNRNNLAMGQGPRNDATKLAQNLSQDTKAFHSQNQQNHNYLSHQEEQHQIELGDIQQTQKNQLNRLHDKLPQNNSIQIHNTVENVQKKQNGEKRTEDAGQQKQGINPYSNNQQKREQVLQSNANQSGITSQQADMSFDNESVQNEPENKSEDRSREHQASMDFSNRSFANNDDYDDATVSANVYTNRTKKDDAANNKGKAPNQKKQTNQMKLKEGQGQPMPSNSVRLINQSDAFASMLDESSDLEQVQNNQLPGYIHGGANTSAASGFNSHLQSLHSQRSQGPSDGQFSALSRGQLFGGQGGKDQGTQNGMSPQNSRDMNCDYSIGLVNGLGLTTDREELTDRYSDARRPMGTIESQPQTNNNTDHFSSLENFDAPQVNLDMKTAKPPIVVMDGGGDSTNRLGDTGLAASGTSIDGNIQSASEDERQRSLKKLPVAQTNFQEEMSGKITDPQSFRDLERLIKSENLSPEQQRALEQDIWKFNQWQREMKQQQMMNDESEEIIPAQANRQQQKDPVDSSILPSDYDEPPTDLEGNETENEVIRDHLEGFQAIEEGQHPGAGGGIASALKGLESDLETIFETDMESNYVTTSRTNLSTKKFLNQAQNKAHIQQLNAQLSNPRSQERLSRILLSQCSPIAHTGSASNYSSSNFKRGGGGSGNQKDQMHLLPPQGSSSKANNLSSTNSKRKQELEDTMSPGVNATGTDTSQSMLVSNRSNPVQQVKSSQNIIHPGRHLSPNQSTPQQMQNKHQVAAQAHCFLTSEQLGKLTQPVQQSQQDREEHRIRVYTSATNSHSSRPLSLLGKAEAQKNVAVREKSQCQTQAQNKFQEIKEESIEDDVDQQYDPRQQQAHQNPITQTYHSNQAYQSNKSDVVGQHVSSSGTSYHKPTMFGQAHAFTQQSNQQDAVQRQLDPTEKGGQRHYTHSFGNNIAATTLQGRLQHQMSGTASSPQEVPLNHDSFCNEEDVEDPRVTTHGMNLGMDVDLGCEGEGGQEGRDGGLGEVPGVDHTDIPQFIRGRDSSFDNGDEEEDAGATSGERQGEQEGGDMFQFR